MPYEALSSTSVSFFLSSAAAPPRRPLSTSPRPLLLSSAPVPSRSFKILGFLLDRALILTPIQLSRYLSLVQGKCFLVARASFRCITAGWACSWSFPNFDHVFVLLLLVRFARSTTHTIFIFFLSFFLRIPFLNSRKADVGEFVVLIRLWDLYRKTVA